MVSSNVALAKQTGKHVFARRAKHLLDFLRNFASRRGRDELRGAEKSPAHKFRFSEAIQPIAAAQLADTQDFSLRKPETMYHTPISSHPEGRTRRHLRGTRMRWTQAVPGEGMQRADGEGVWSCPPDAGVNPGSKARGTEARKPGTPGRARDKP